MTISSASARSGALSVLTATPCTSRITSVASTSGRMIPACWPFASSRSVVWRIVIQQEDISSDSTPTASISAFDRPRLVTRYAFSERTQAVKACSGEAVSRSASASPHTVPTWLRKTAACRSTRVGKCR